MKKTIQELANIIGGVVKGDSTAVIEEVCGLAEAGSGHITFAVEPYTEYLPKVHAGAVLVEKEVPCGDNTLIIVDNPKLAFSKLLMLFHPKQKVERTIHPTVVQGGHVAIGARTAIMAYTVIGDNVTIGDDCIIYPYTFIGDNVTIGKGTVLFPGTVIHENCVLGERVIARAHAVIGGEGFGFATKDGRHTRIPQIGNVIIGDDVEIGSATAIDNATLGSTTVKRGTKIDNLVHLGHNVEIGEDCFIIAQVGIAGSTKVGNHVILAGQTGCNGHITIGDNAVFAGKSGIIGNLEGGQVYAGFPARPHMQWARDEVLMRKLPDMVKKIKQMEKRLAELEKQ